MGIWALSFGAAVGWGSFAMPGTTFLPAAGPLGTVLGLLLGAVVMFIIGINYHYLMKQYPDAGGAYAYAKRIFGYDYGFLSAWFLLLTYVAILWANATALSLFVRVLFGDVFQFGFHYSLAGFDIYFGEILLSIAAVVLLGLLCAFFRRAAQWAQIAGACVLIVGVLVVFGSVLARNGFTLPNLEPLFANNGEGHFEQILSIVALAPWAYVGFESVSHSTEEFSSAGKKKVFLILIASLFTAAAAYVLLALAASTALPEGFAGREEYLAHLGELSGSAGLPSLFAAETALGPIGKVAVALAMMGGIVTGIIANYVAASRLTYSLARDGLFPPVLSKINKAGAPGNAVLLIMAFSLFILFLGRTAVSWIVDVTTIGAAVAYALVSLSALRSACGEKKCRFVVVTGAVGALLSLFLLLYFLLPELGRDYALSAQSYLILVVWSVLGILFVRVMIGYDKKNRIGRSAVVWVVMLIIVVLISVLWVRQTVANVTETARAAATAQYEATLASFGADPAAAAEAAGVLEEQIRALSDEFLVSNMIQIGIIIVSLGLVFLLFTVVQKKHRQTEMEKLRAEQDSRAKSTFLSNMSHDIRTPMNAVIGYTTIAMKEPDLPPRVAEYLGKIDFSSRHLLSLINDVLDMSRIESGKIELEPEAADITATMEKMRDIFSAQMEEKGVVFTVDASSVTHRCVSFDENRFMRVLLNLVSNALKFTPKDGSVTVTLEEIGADEKEAAFVLRVEDTGIGMSREFAEHVFDAFERERDKTVKNIQGTGLGMAITKSFIDLMGGTIRVDTEKGSGTKFTICFALPICDEEKIVPETAREEEKIAFTGKKLLVVDDNPINIEIACMLLQSVGFVTEAAENGKQAFDRVAASAPGEFDAVLMDVQMPVMNGYEATVAIRGLGSPVSRVPIVAMSANAFAEDVQEAKEAGMNAHVAKPIDVNALMSTLRSLLK